MQIHKHSLKSYTAAATRIMHNYSDIHNAAGEEWTRRSDEVLAGWQWGPEKKISWGESDLTEWINFMKCMLVWKHPLKTILKPNAK